VVLSAGSFSTPGILERPEVCAKSILEGVVVKQRVDLPRIGKNYQSPSVLHPRSLLIVQAQVTDFGTLTCRSQHFIHSIFAADEAQTLDAILRNDENAVKGISDTLSERLS
jgi:hypothetical protein